VDSLTCVEAFAKEQQGQGGGEASKVSSQGRCPEQPARSWSVPTEDEAPNQPSGLSRQHLADSGGGGGGEVDVDVEVFASNGATPARLTTS
jgi:hypothetical protein